ATQSQAQQPAGSGPSSSARLPARRLAAGTDGLALTGMEQIEIIADDVRNALVILAAPQDYRMVEAALRRLDVVPLQVMIEARIMEVTLRGDLSYGVEWFFRNAVSVGDRRGDGFGALD